MTGAFQEHVARTEYISPYTLAHSVKLAAYQRQEIFERDRLSLPVKCELPGDLKGVAKQWNSWRPRREALLARADPKDFVARGDKSAGKCTVDEKVRRHVYVGSSSLEGGKQQSARSMKISRLLLYREHVMIGSAGVPRFALPAGESTKGF